MRAVILASLFAGSAFATEAIYLTFTQNAYGQCGNNQYYEGDMIYYDNIDQSHDQQQPDDRAFVGCGEYPWDGRSTVGYFGSGATFTVRLQSGALEYSTGQYAGHGHNNFGTGFNCYRDNDRQLFCDRGGCSYSRYYCIQQ